MNAAPRHARHVRSRASARAVAWPAPAHFADSAGAVDPEGVRVAPLTPAAGALRDGEVVILRLKPHPIYVLLSSLSLLFFVMAMALPLYLLAEQPWSPLAPRWVFTLSLLVALGRLLWQTLDWWARDYVLTDRRVIAAAGVIRRARFEAPLRNIQHVGMQQSVLERLFALGTLSFATAGTAGYDALWLTVERPLETLRIVRETIERYR